MTRTRAVVTLMLSGLGLLVAGALAVTSSGVYPVALLMSGPDAQGHAPALLLGAWQAGHWQPPAAALPLLKASRPWRMQSLGTPGKAGQTLLSMGGVALPGAAPCLEIVFLDFKVPASSPEFLLVTSPELKVRPRPVEVLPTTGAVYRESVRAELLRRGLKSPVLNIDSVTRADLDGDGTLEVIIGASHFRQASGDVALPPRAEAGDYSLLLLRWVKNGQVQTTVLSQNVFTTTPTQKQLDDGGGQVPTRYRLAGVADLNNDGRMELVVADASYESEGAVVLEWSPAGGVKERLSEGCGA
ncbi:FG-GAP repeat domain-containing protein [Deinococcus sp.]|uniref:FG-GAP repeat domain-containing protein n=1 Tax=Deinococcus sp. TaxID=47478 RepID=UPI003C7DDC3F